MFTFGSAVKTMGVRREKISKKKRRQRGGAMFRRKYKGRKQKSDKMIVRIRMLSREDPYIAITSAE